LSTAPADIIFNNELQDYGECYDPTTGMFTPHSTGLFRFTLNLLVSAMSPGQRVRFTIRDTSGALTVQQIKVKQLASGTPETLTFDGVVRLTAGHSYIPNCDNNSGSTVPLVTLFSNADSSWHLSEVIQ
jgi:hypothetical protein